MKLKRLIVTLIFLNFTLIAGPALSKTDYITVGWAQWEPADALMELSKDFTAQTGIEVRGVFTPWPSFQERVFSELNAKGDSYDVLIGDSQWIGAGAVFGHYIELTDFFSASSINLKQDFAPGPVFSYCTWPKGSDRYWALPCEGDAVGWTYRKDWFSRPDLRRLFKREYGYELGVPENWKQLTDIANFFQGRVIDGQTVNGAAIYTNRAGDGITMGVTHAMYANGVIYQNPEKPYDLDGYFNSEKAAAALETYKSLYTCCTPSDWGSAYMMKNLEAYTSGKVAMAMNFFAFFPGISKHPKVGAATGYFSNPPMSTRGATLGGQGMSIVAYSKKKEIARAYLKWFAQPSIQQKWWALGGFSCHKAVLNDPSFLQSFPYAKGYKESMEMVYDFWQEPNYGQLLYTTQRLFHKYVVADEGTAKGSLDQIVKEWKEEFTDAGKY